MAIRKTSVNLRYFHTQRYDMTALHSKVVYGREKYLQVMNKMDNAIMGLDLIFDKCFLFFLESIKDYVLYESRAMI